MIIINYYLDHSNLFQGVNIRSEYGIYSTNLLNIRGMDYLYLNMFIYLFLAHHVVIDMVVKRGWRHLLLYI